MKVEGLRLASAIPKRRACFQDDNRTDWFLQKTIINGTRGTINHKKKYTVHVTGRAVLFVQEHYFLVGSYVLTRY